MPSIICHHKGRYNIYSTVSDGFRFVGSLDRNQLEQLTKEEYGKQGLEQLADRLVRAHQSGTSSINPESLDGLLCCNRAGENEAHLSTEQCIKQFLS